MFNKDIKLKPTNHGQYDREFYNNDFKIVTGPETLQNSIIISLMTRLGELNHNYTYQGFGCGAHNYLKQNNTTLAKINIKEEIKHNINKIKGIKSVEQLEIEPKHDNLNVMNIFLMIRLEDNTINNEQFQLGGI